MTTMLNGRFAKNYTAGNVFMTTSVACLFPVALRPVTPLYNSCYIFEHFSTTLFFLINQSLAKTSPTETRSMTRTTYLSASLSPTVIIKLKNG